jgi:hypothetical protein
MPLIACVLLVSLVLVPLTVKADPPAYDDRFTVQEDSIDNPLEVLANDTPPDGLTIVAVTQGNQGGRVEIIDDDTRVSYTPQRDFFGLEQFTYTVRDGRGGSDLAQVFVTVNGVNDPPDLDDDSAVTDEDTAVTIDVLDNDEDSDGELDPSSVRRVSGPSRGTVVNVDSTTGEITYRPDNNWYGNDSFTYEACDDGTPLPAQCRRAEVSIRVNEVNDPPIADAGAKQTVQTLTQVTLDGSGSSDPEDNLPLTYYWQQTGGPLVALSSTTAESPTFTSPDDPGTLTFTLTVIDSRGSTSTPDETLVTVINRAPIANAGPDQKVRTGVHVTLDGSRSTDPDHDLPLSYVWNQAGGPTVTLNSATTQSPTFAAPGDPSVLTFDLYVIDALGTPDLSPDRVKITVFEPPVFYVYMPLLTHKYVLAPDLIVERITASGSNLQVVIKNVGNAPVLGNFWVDGYINPQMVPDGVNQPWWARGKQGIAWWVDGQALAALVPGGSFTLRAYDAYYVEPESHISTWPLPAGTTLYAQVDSYSESTLHGLVYESHEQTGDAYNNIHGPVISTATAAGTIPLPLQQQAPSGRDIPQARRR